MKKLFATVFLISIFAIAGCASDNANSSAQTPPPAPETLIPADPNNPSTLIGHYKVDYLSVVEGTNLVSTDCNQANSDFPGFTCSAATFLANLADIQLLSEEGMGNIYSFVIQAQLDGTEIRGGTLKEHAYHHLFFPVQEINIANIKNEINPADTRATERGLSSFFIKRPLGSRGNFNAKVYALTKINDQLFIKLIENGSNMKYAVRLTKTSNNSNGYVTKYDVQNLVDIIYAVSSRFNTLIQSTFDDEALNTLFKDFKSDFPNTPGDPITQ